MNVAYISNVTNVRIGGNQITNVYEFIHFVLKLALGCDVIVGMLYFVTSRDVV